MELKEFKNVIDKVQRYYGKDYNDEQLEEIFKYFKSFSLKRFEYVVSMCYREKKFLPSLADFYEINGKITYKSETIKPEKKKCEICHGRGILKYYKVIQGISYEFIAHCTCSNGAKYVYEDSEGRYIPSIIEIDVLGGKRYMKKILDECFAFNKRSRECRALKEMNCEGCAFYRTDLNWDDIEKDIEDNELGLMKEREIQDENEKLKSYLIMIGKSRDYGLWLKNR